MADVVKNDATTGSKAGVTGTPTLFVNGVKIVGAQPYSVFEQAIENALK
jgi:protein-disulfide isomerase